MEAQESWSISLLTKNELELIESFQAPALVRHRLRILSHSLNFFKLMVNPSTKGPLPSHDIQMKWCLQHPYLKKDKNFIPILLQQLDKAGDEIEQIAERKSRTPLEISITDLINAFSTDNSHY